MPENRTSKSTFNSSKGGGFISPAQFITEQLCIMIARQKQSELPDQFWQLPEWNKIFRRHIADANKLLKKYDVEAILLALRDKRLFRMESFHFPPFKKYLEEHQKAISAKKAKEAEIEYVDYKAGEASSRTDVFTKKTGISKLKALEKKNE